MPRRRAAAVRASRPLAELVSVGMLTRVFPPDLIDEVIDACGRTEQRRRRLPARLMAYFTMGMALTAEGSYEDVLALVQEGLAWAGGSRVLQSPANKAAITQARGRLGPEPMAALFARVARPLGRAGTPGAFVAGRRVVTIDGTNLDVADSEANEAHFGHPPGPHHESRFPEARVLALAECGTGAILSAVIVPRAVPDGASARDLFADLAPGMLCCGDDAVCGYESWVAARARGADLLWRASDDLELEPVEQLLDGSWSGRLHDPARRARNRGVDVRLIDIVADNLPVRLVTTILDPADAAAAELVTAYLERWTIELSLDYARQSSSSRPVLRSRSPRLVEQEIWGRLCCDYAVRFLMSELAAAPTN